MDTETPPPPQPPPPPPELGMVARAVQRLVARNDAAAAEGDRPVGIVNGMAVFEAAGRKGAARIGVGEYLERVHRYAGLEAECYVAAYAYLDMAAHRRPAAAVASRNVHRLLLACLLLASKFLDDFHHNNAFFARVGGVSNAEMNKLELELLTVLDFRVMLSRRLYDLYRAHLHKSSEATASPTDHVKTLEQPQRSPDGDDGDGEVDDGHDVQHRTTKLQNGTVVRGWSEVMANGGTGVRRPPARYSFSG